MKIMYKKAISIILVMLMVFGGLNGVFVGGEKAYAVDVFAAGTGTMNDPYQIATAAQLDMIRNHPGTDKYFKLINDIDLTEYLSEEGAGYNGGAGWVPIGSYMNEFTGKLDGNGFRIKNLIIKLPAEPVGNDGFSVGLFGVTRGTITNIILENINVEGINSVGTLAGQNFGSITNSSVTGSVYTNPTNIGINIGNNIGGFVGINGSQGTIDSSYSAVNVSGVVANQSNSGFSIGGFVGFNNQGYISNSYATGNVSGNIGVGGLVGSKSQGSITNSYATGVVNGNGAKGGLVGESDYGIYNSFYDSGTTGQSDINKGEGKPIEDMQTITTFTNWDFDSIWYLSPNKYPQLWAFTTLSPGTNNGTTKLNNVPLGMEYSLDGVNYTVITDTSIDNIAVIAGDTISVRVIGTLSPKAFTVRQPNIKPVEFAGGNGEVASPYQIATVAQLSEVRNHLDPDIYFELIDDIDLNGHTNWEPIGNEVEFNGNFDGNGFRIKNLNINLPDKSGVGFFGSIGDLGTITNISLENVNLEGNESVGSLAGFNRGSISNITVTGNVYGASNVGGLVGINNGSYGVGIINNSYSAVSVGASSGYAIGGLVGLNYLGTINDSYATGDVIGYGQVGGLVGDNQYGTLNNSYATGEVSGYSKVGGLLGSINGIFEDGIVKGTITNSYATGFINGTIDVSGLVGFVYGEPSITNSFYDSETTGQPEEDIGKGVGIPTEDMQTINTFTDWDFDSIWYLLSDQYPQLWAFTTLTPGTNSGTTKLNNVAQGMEYSLDGDDYIAITGTYIDNIAVIAGDTISVRVTGTSPLSPKTLTVRQTNIKPLVVIATAAIAGVTAPATGTTPVTTVTVATDYTGSVTWSPSPVTFAASTAYIATITITPQLGYTLTGVAANFFTVAGATTTNDANSGVVTAVFPATAATPAPTPAPTPTNGTVTSTNGNLTLPAGRTGEVNLGDKVTVSIPRDATDKALEITIDEVKNTQNLVMNNGVLVSPVFEILKNFSENFIKPVTLTFIFDLAIVKSNQRVAVFYYDEVKKIWVEVGGKVSVNRITVEVGHFTKFAVMAVDEEPNTPIKDPSPATMLNDISGHWAEANIKQAVSIGFIKGYTDGTFKPNQTVTRAEFSVMLINALKLQGAGAELTFTDTAKIGAWAQKAVAQAVQAGIIKGYEDGTLRPNAKVTRTEMAAMIANALKLIFESDTSTGFADDKSIPSWAKGAVAELKKLGLIAGTGMNQFNPNAQATRAEAVTVLLKMLALDNK
jgi:hypothetical protein